MSQSESHPFRPDYLIPPGETLRDRLAEMNLSQAELAARAGLSAKHVNQIVKGTRADHPGDRDRAGTDHRHPGERVEPQRSRLPGRAAPRQAARSRPPRTSGGCRRFRSRNCRNGAGSRPNATAGRLFDAVLSFFGVADRAAWERIWRGPVASFRRSHAYTSDPGAVVSWLRIAQTEAQQAKAAAVLGTAVPQGLAGDPLSDSARRRQPHRRDVRCRRASSSYSSAKSRAAASAAPRGGQLRRAR